MSRCRRRTILGMLASSSLTGLPGCNLLSSGHPTTTPETATLSPSDGDRGDEFGHSVTFGEDGDIALIGAPRDEDPNGTFAGTAYVFERTNNGWTEASKLTPTDGEDGAHFGWSVALAGDTALIGTPFDDTHTGENGGVTYVFERGSDGWTEAATLTPTTGDDGDRFGAAVALAATGDIALIGAPHDEDATEEEAGAAYVFERPSQQWTQAATLMPTDGDDGDRFGATVALAATGDITLVGAPHDEDTTGKKVGAAYVFERPLQHWTEPTKLTPVDSDTDDFGNAVALVTDGSIALIGGTETEAAYQFRRPTDRWTEASKLTPTNREEVTDFGWSVAVAGDTALIGAPDDEPPTGEPDGVAYVFEPGSDGWTEAAALAPDAGDIGDDFAESVALAGNTALVGAPKGESSNGEVTGVVYVFDL